MSITSPIFFTAIRKLIAGACLLGLYHYKGSLKKRTIDVQSAFLFGVVTFFGVILTNLPECWALKFVPSAKSAFIYSLSPFYSAILAYFLLDEMLTFKKLLGMVVGFIGFGITLLKDAPTEVSEGGFWIISKGEIALTVAAISTAIGWMGMRQLVRKGFSSLLVNGVTMLIGGGLSLVISPLFEVWEPIPVENFTLFGTYLFLAVVCSNLIGYTLYGYLLQRYSTTLLSFAGFSETFFAAIYGWIFLGESLAWHFYVSSLLVLCGLRIFYTEEWRQGYVLSP